MGNINFDQASTGTTTGQPHTLTVVQKTPAYPEFPVPMTALWARCDAGEGVLGESFSVDATGAGSGVHGRGSVNGVFGETTNRDASGVYGQNDGGGYGVTGSSDLGSGVFGRSGRGAGVSAQTESSAQSGLFGRNLATDPVPDGLGYPAGNGVWGHTKTPNGSGVCGSVEPNTQAAGVTGIGPIAGQFFGDVNITGKVSAPNSTIHCFDVFCLGADCAEEFEISGTEEVGPGTVMVIDQEGALTPSTQAYDRKVAGVISGAGDYRPAIVLDRQSLGNTRRVPIALVGKVFCRVDADICPIEIGDLLTTSHTPGHAMKVANDRKAFGSVIGKALRSIEAGRGLIPILIALQ